jgi:hypothetical protein
MAATTKKATRKTTQGTARRRSPGLSAAQRNRLPARDFAFARERKEPITDARHVRNAIARFDQVEDVTDAERDTAWRKILRAAKKFGVEVDERDWRELVDGGRTTKPRRGAAAKRR